MNKTLKNALCPHRGLGDENSLDAIKAAIDTSPFMVEFDIQNIDGEYYLGHPPVINYKAKLEDALILYNNTIVVPKIDVKCSKNWKEDVDLVLDKISSSHNNMLINLGGDNLNADEFMKAENYLLNNSKSNVLLNIDIIRYKNKTKSVIEKHVNSLSKIPFSISPMLENDYESEINIALGCGIKNIHFWSSGLNTYTEKELVNLLDKYSSENINVLFDINPSIIEI